MPKKSPNSNSSSSISSKSSESIKPIKSNKPSKKLNLFRYLTLLTFILSLLALFSSGYLFWKTQIQQKPKYQKTQSIQTIQKSTQDYFNHQIKIIKNNQIAIQNLKQSIQFLKNKTTQNTIQNNTQPHSNHSNLYNTKNLKLILNRFKNIQTQLLMRQFKWAKYNRAPKKFLISILKTIQSLNTLQKNTITSKLLEIQSWPNLKLNQTLNIIHQLNQTIPKLVFKTPKSIIQKSDLKPKLEQGWARLKSLVIIQKTQKNGELLLKTSDQKMIINQIYSTLNNIQLSIQIGNQNLFKYSIKYLKNIISKWFVNNSNQKKILDLIKELSLSKIKY